MFGFLPLTISHALYFGSFRPSIYSSKNRSNYACTKKYDPFFLIRGLRTMTLALHHRHAIACVQCKCRPAVCKLNIAKKRKPN
ncbi:unnamed protein product [Prunus brigantina]